MGVSLDGYKAAILRLLPAGKAWQGLNFRALIQSFAVEVWRVSEQVDTLTVEAFPSTTSAMLPDYERLVGLPYPGFALAGTEVDRRSDVLAKFIAQGGQSKAYYLTILAHYGFGAATIDDGITPFVAGSSAGDLLYSIDWVFLWVVNMPSGMGTDPALKCEYLLNRYKPAHTIVRFDY